MDATTKAYYRIKHEDKHLHELQALGYTGKSMRQLRTLEHWAHRMAEMSCNGDIDDLKYSKAELHVKEQVTSLFGGVLPKGFFFNGDARGYALKLDDEMYKNEDKPLSYTDFGGYMILAPKRNEM